jgi:molybdate transport system regulatory protein
MQIRTKLSILDNAGKFTMGPGPKRLLENIDKYHSINKAAKQMSLSYVKALNMIKGIEKGLDRQVVIRKKGGNERGGARLTPYGKAFVVLYRELEKTIRQYSEKEFDRFQLAIEKSEIEIDEQGDEDVTRL